MHTDNKTQTEQKGSDHHVHGNFIKISLWKDEPNSEDSVCDTLCRSFWKAGNLITYAE
ncbi:hypothetical protein SPBRAN_1149 [uncultured Candidatus Thioglobus sp.]|nr:hypothetical protein SPBRAN_1149 [uncultured Candidatus Thioglobus sp.]